MLVGFGRRRRFHVGVGGTLLTLGGLALERRGDQVLFDRRVQLVVLCWSFLANVLFGLRMHSAEVDAHRLGLQRELRIHVRWLRLCSFVD